MKKKVVPVVASVLGASLLLTACGGNKDNASGAKANDKAPDKQAINLSFASRNSNNGCCKSNGWGIHERNA